MTEQQARRRTWAATRDFTSKDADDFAETIREKGFKEAMREVLSRPNKKSPHPKVVFSGSNN